MTSQYETRSNKKVTGKKNCSGSSKLPVFRNSSAAYLPANGNPALCYLSERPMRYNDLYRIIPNISRKMLSEHLKELEADSLIERIQYDNKLQRVEYSLSVKGNSLIPVLHQLQNWG